MTFLETTVLVRYLTRDDPMKAGRCEQLFKRAEAGREELCLTHLVLAETVWVLSSHYQFSNVEIARGLKRILNTPHLFCEEISSLLAAVDLYESTTLSFIDAYHATVLPDKGITTFYSYDTDFDRIAGITRREP